MPYEPYSVIVYSDQSHEVIVRDFKIHKTYMHFPLSDHISHVSFLKLYKAIVFGSINGKLIIYDYKLGGIIYSDMILNDRVVSVIENFRVNGREKTISKMDLKSIKASLFVLYRTCLMSFSI